MVIFEENKLDEMAVLVISSVADDLPFRVAINSPDHPPPHAHVLDKETGTKELGQFLLSDRLPRKPIDIKDFKQGITDEIREVIFKWARLPHKSFRKYKNWEVLNFQFDFNKK